MSALGLLLLLGLATAGCSGKATTTFQSLDSDPIDGVEPAEPNAPTPAPAATDPSRPPSLWQPDESPHVGWPLGAGGPGSDLGSDVAVDAAGDIYIVGAFEHQMEIGETLLTSAGEQDLFVVKLSAEGELRWALSAGGPGWDAAMGVAVAGGDVLISGHLAGEITFGDSSYTSSGPTDAFVARLSPDGALQWLTQLGGPGEALGRDIAVAPDGSSVVTGSFANSIQVGDDTLISHGWGDMLLAGLSADGELLWARSGGGEDSDGGVALARDPDGAIYVTGYFGESATWGATTLQTAGTYDLLLAKYAADGELLWVTSGGGPDWDAGLDIAVDASGQPVVTGYITYSATFGATSLVSAGWEDVLVARFSSSGEPLWASCFGGAGADDRGSAVDLDGAGNAWVAGYFMGDAQFGDETVPGYGWEDAFVASLSPAGDPQWVRHVGGTYWDEARGLALDAQGQAHVVGFFSEQATIDDQVLTSQGEWDLLAWTVSAP